MSPAAIAKPRAVQQELTARAATLTRREHEVFHWVVTGRLNKQIAAALGTTEKTIKVHRARVMTKMHAESVADLVRMFDQLGEPSLVREDAETPPRGLKIQTPPAARRRFSSFAGRTRAENRRSAARCSAASSATPAS